MSSSAFTPSTTTVTNNVPVNVPVVTAWQDYTPTGGWTTNTTYIGKWRRIGESIHVQVKVSLSGAPNASSLTITIPSGLTINTSSMASSDTITNALGTWIGVRQGVGFYNGVVGYNSTNSICLSVNNSGVVVAQTNPAIWANSDFLSVNFMVPISQWASSGTTTLATRAVEEYAYNTDTTNASNTSAFGYGPDGVNFLSTTPATAAISKRVRFQTPIQPTDSIIFEVNTNGLWRQLSAEAATTAGQQIYNYITHYNNAYGAGRILQVNSTDVDVSFAKYASTGTTYDAASGGLWGSIVTGTAKWRVRKVSSGAQVGYPVSARNIVGDTSGAVVPTGMLGETIEFTGSNVAASASNTGFTCISGYAVPAGKWLITGNCHLVKGTGTGITYLLAGINTSNSSPANYNTTYAVNPTEAGLQTNSLIVDSNGSSQIFMRAQYDFSAVGSSVVVGRLQLVRIA